MFAYVGIIQYLKDLKGLRAGGESVGEVVEVVPPLLADQHVP